MNTEDEPFIRVHCSNAFEGAKVKYREDRKRLIDGTPDQIAVNEILLLQLRTAHALRNNGYAKTAAQKYVTNLGSLKVNWVNKKTKKANTEMQDAWDEFAANPMLDGYGNLDTWQSVSNFNRFATGASFTRKHIRRRGNLNKVPLKLEQIQTQLHDISYFGANLDPQIKFGMKFQDTKPLSYFFRLNLYQEFPYNNLSTVEPTEIPADEIIHSFIRTQPGQWIGIPELAAVLIPLYEIDDLVEVSVAKQKIAQAISIIVTGSSPINQLPVGTTRSISRESGKEVTPTNSDRESVELKTEGTNIIYPRKGENVSIFQGTDIGMNLLGLIKFELRRVCNAADVPYHLVTGDMEGINFSSLRSLMVELRTRIEFIHKFYTVPLELLPLANTFRSLASLRKSSLGNTVPLFQLPRFHGVDDLKDAQADKLEMQSGFGLLKNALDERHISYEELIEDLELRKELKEKYDFDLLAGDTKSQANNVEPNPKTTGI